MSIMRKTLGKKLREHIGNPIKTKDPIGKSIPKPKEIFYCQCGSIIKVHTSVYKHLRSESHRRNLENLRLAEEQKREERERRRTVGSVNDLLERWKTEKERLIRTCLSRGLDDELTLGVIEFVDKKLIAVLTSTQELVDKTRSLKGDRMVCFCGQNVHRDYYWDHLKHERHQQNMKKCLEQNSILEKLRDAFEDLQSFVDYIDEVDRDSDLDSQEKCSRVARYLEQYGYGEI